MSSITLTSYSSKINNNMDIQRPSDIKLKISSIKDSKGVDIDVSVVYLIFIIKDKYGHKFLATSDPFGTDSANTVIGDDGFLYILIENTNLQGCLEMSVGIREEDQEFPDGYCQTFSEFKPLNINYI